MEIYFKQIFRKRLKRVPQKIRSRFYERLELFCSNPTDRMLNNHAVDARFPGCRSINVTGDYRAIYTEKGKIIVFEDIGSHADLYN